MNVNELIDRRTKLAMMTDIPDFDEYADDWRKLGNDFEEIGAINNATLCYSNWMRYKNEAATVERFAPKVRVTRRVEANGIVYMQVQNTTERAAALLKKHIRLTPLELCDMLGIKTNTLIHVLTPIRDNVISIGGKRVEYYEWREK